VNTVAWIREIAGAGSAASVVEIVKRFVDGIDKTELEMLPAECRPRRIGSTTDVASWAFTFATASLSLDELAPVHELSLVFSEASSRIAALALGEHRAAQLREVSRTPTVE